MRGFPFWFYIVVGLIILAVGGAAKWYVDRIEDAKVEALLSPSPDPIQIEALNLDKDVGPSNEVTIRAQLDMSISGLVTNLDPDNPRTGTYFGLFATGALDNKRVVKGVLLSEDFILDDAYLDTIIVAKGPFGPIVEINGRVGSPDAVWRQIERELEGLGRTFSRDTLTIVPFVEGREVALRPDADRGNMLFGLFALVGAVYIAYGIFRWFSRRRRT